MNNYLSSDVQWRYEFGDGFSLKTTGYKKHSGDFRDPHGQLLGESVDYLSNQMTRHNNCIWNVLFLDVQLQYLSGELFFLWMTCCNKYIPIFLFHDLHL